MKSFYQNDVQDSIVVINDAGDATVVSLVTAGNPSSIEDHVPADIKAACQAPLPKTDWDAYLAALPKPAPPSAAEKLAAAGLTVEELKALLAS